MTGTPILHSRELSASAEDRALLDQFYEELYVREFPDPDERESLANMARYLELKAAGWYGRNAYHIFLLLNAGIPVAGSVVDYLAEANAGVIEFFVTAEAWRNRGIGRRLLEWTERAIAEDAHRSLGRDADWIVAEMQDPFKMIDPAEDFDPFLRALIWDRWGFHQLDFPYVQPALSDGQQPVRHLLLTAKVLGSEFRDGMPAEVLKRVLHQYMRWAMRIEEPERNREYQEMSRALETSRARDQTATVGLVPLATYVGRDTERPLLVREITDAADRDLSELLSVYEDAFPAGRTTAEADAFRGALRAGRHRDQPYAYRLWAVRSSPEGGVEGVASFFTFPGAGYGGYVAFHRSLRGSGRLRSLLARMEERMLRDRQGARGWYIECAAAEADVFRRMGFHEIALTYRQPPLHGQHDYPLSEAPILRLMYKEFGRTYHAPRVSQQVFLEALEWIYRVVYRIDVPQESFFFLDVQAQLAATPGETLLWH